MHDSAFVIGSKFLELYVTEDTRLVLELGSMDVNGTLRSACPPSATYVGVDMEAGKGVDIVIAPKQALPIRSNSADVIISTSQMEHDPFFWRTFLELVRVLKPGGVLYINAPSNGLYHRYPVDLWRFYPDSGRALADWAKENGHSLCLIESFVAERRGDVWNDFVATFVKSPAIDRGFPFLCELFPSHNVYIHSSAEILRHAGDPEDMRIIAALRKELASCKEQIVALESELASNRVSGATKRIEQ
jgi:SAM-dependent methyltransferase